jgi:ribosome-binding protein aMBF1 (putative translation factor)
MTEKQLKAVGAAVSLATQKAGSVDELCAILDLSRSSVYRWIRGDAVISIPMAKKLAKFTQIGLVNFRPDVFEEDDDDAAATPLT